MNVTLSPSIRRPAVPRLPHILRIGGMYAGAGGGFAMMFTGAIGTGLFGHESWLYPKSIAGLIDRLLTSTHLDVGATPLLLGLAIHLVVAALLGAIFDMVYHRILHLTTDFGLPTYIGLTYSLWLWVASYFVVLPALGAELTEAHAAPFLVQHIVFGVVTGLLYLWLAPEPYHER